MSDQPMRQTFIPPAYRIPAFITAISLVAFILLPALNLPAIAQQAQLPRPGDYSDAKDWLAKSLDPDQALDENVRDDLVDCMWKRMEDKFSPEEIEDLDLWARGEEQMAPATRSLLQRVQREMAAKGLDALRDYCPDKIQEFQSVIQPDDQQPDGQQPGEQQEQQDQPPQEQPQ